MHPLLPRLFNRNPEDQTKPEKEQVETELKHCHVPELPPLHREKAPRETRSCFARSPEWEEIKQHISSSLQLFG